MGVLVEICACSVEDVVGAYEGGAQRVELCSALPLGGLTPSAGMIAESKRRSQLPVMVMIRPRCGGFAYSKTDLETMERDIDIAREFGADGLVFGVLNDNGTIDTKRTAQLTKRAGNLKTVFHRAFDVTPNPMYALEQVVDLGFTRILTSGQKRYAHDGAELIKQLIDTSAGRVEIMPGGGVRPHNLRDLVDRTGCRMVHLSAHMGLLDRSTHGNPLLTFGSTSSRSEDQIDVIDRSVVAAIVAEADAL